MSRITVLLADDNLLVREGVRALLTAEDDLEVVGVASDFDQLVSEAEKHEPQVVVTDIRMPPNFQTEGIDAAKLVRKRNPGTGVVILSQYDEPEYAISLLSEGSEGYAYLLKDRVAEGDQLVRAVKQVAGGGSMLDPRIVQALVRPVATTKDLTEDQETLLQLIAEGRPTKSIAASLHTTPEHVSQNIDALFLKIAEGASAGSESAVRRLKMLHQAIVDRDVKGESLGRLLPGGVVEKLLGEGKKIGDTEKLVVTVLMSDIRGYSTIAESLDPTALAAQLNDHRREMNDAILKSGGTVWQFIGDAVMAVFGAPLPQKDHAARSVMAAEAMHESQHRVNREWEAAGLPPFNIGIGISTGEVAAALLGSEERVEYTLIGDTVNMAQRLQQWAAGGQTVLSESTFASLERKPDAKKLEPATVKGRQTPVMAYRMESSR